jgi:hypothetical protein
MYIYIWNNNCRSDRKYPIQIEFENIEVRNNIKESEKAYIISKSTCMVRSLGYTINYKFLFGLKNTIDYDVIIHIRGGDRLSNTIKHGDFSNNEELLNYITKTIHYVNNSSDISTYTIVTDSIKHKEEMKSKINKKYIELDYNNDISKDWLDFYYLTKPKLYIIMCCKFSSYSICASILGNKKLYVYKNSINSNLPRYKANINFIDE